MNIYIKVTGIMLLLLRQCTPLYTYSIAFVHLGNKIPDFVSDNLLQTRIFNKNCPIYLLANQQALNNYVEKQNLNITFIPVETLEMSPTHKQFQQKSTLDKIGGDGFWFFTSERFLFLDDFMQQYNVTDLFHLENDVMLYRDLNDLLPIFKEHYKHIAATFDNDTRCIPGFLYIATPSDMHALAEEFLATAHQGKNDMQVLCSLRNKYGTDRIDTLPIIMPEYKEHYPLKNQLCETTTNPEHFSHLFEVFDSIFDAAAIGQYLGGVSPMHQNSKPGFVNERALFDVSRMTYEMREDEEGRKFPVMIFKNKDYRINNLHIHCKNLKPFLSREAPLKDSLTKSNSVIPSYSGGRFGDNLLAFACTLYFAKKHNLTMMHVPFPYADKLVLDDILPKYHDTMKTNFTKVNKLSSTHNHPKSNDNNTLFIVPYFPDDHGIEYTSQVWPRFFIDWNDSSFKHELQKLIKPKKDLILITPPAHKISIAVHVRKADNYDHWQDNDRMRNEVVTYKAPFDAFYINQLKFLANMFKDAQLYVHIFTDSSFPEKLAEKYKKAVSHPNIEFDYRKTNNSDTNHVLEDFFSLTLFDILIRSESHFSSMAQKISNHAIVITPGKFLPNSRIQEGCFTFAPDINHLYTKNKPGK